VLRTKTPTARRQLDDAFEAATRVREEVMSVLLTSEADRAMFKIWSDDVGQSFNWTVPTLERAHASQRALVIYFQDLVAERRRAPGDDLLSALMSGEQGSRLSEQELLATCVFLLFGRTRDHDQSDRQRCSGRAAPSAPAAAVAGGSGAARQCH